MTISSSVLITTMLLINFFKYIKDASVSGFSLTAYGIAVIGTIYIGIRNQRLRILMRKIEKIPEKDRKELIERELSVKIKSGLNPKQYVLSKKINALVIAFITLCFCMLVIAIQVIINKRNSSTKKISGIVYDGPGKTNPLKGAFVYTIANSKKDSSNPRFTGSDGKFLIDVDTSENFQGSIFFGKDSISDNAIFNSNDYVEIHLISKAKNNTVTKFTDTDKKSVNPPVKQSTITNYGKAKNIVQANQIDTLVINNYN